MERNIQDYFFLFKMKIRSFWTHTICPLLQKSHKAASLSIQMLCIHIRTFRARNPKIWIQPAGWRRGLSLTWICMAVTAGPVVSVFSGGDVAVGLFSSQSGQGPRPAAAGSAHHMANSQRVSGLLQPHSAPHSLLLLPFCFYFPSVSLWGFCI